MPHISAKPHRERMARAELGRHLCSAQWLTPGRAKTASKIVGHCQAVALGDSLCVILSSAIPCQPRPKSVRESRVGGGFPLGRYIGPYARLPTTNSKTPFVGPYSSKRGQLVYDSLVVYERLIVGKSRMIHQQIP